MRLGCHYMKSRDSAGDLCFYRIISYEFLSPFYSAQPLSLLGYNFSVGALHWLLVRKMDRFIWK